MDDLISRKAAIRWVKTECNPYGQPTLDYESGIKVIEHLERMSSAQPEVLAHGEGELLSTQQEPQWIPCSERLPEEDFWSGRGRQFSNHVLVTIVNHANDDEQFTDIAQTVDGIWQLSHDVDGDCGLPNWEREE